MLVLNESGILVKVAENKVADAIYKVIKTKGPSNEFAMACSGGLFFVRYEKVSNRANQTKFIVSSDFMLADLIIT